MERRYGQGQFVQECEFAVESVLLGEVWWECRLVGVEFYLGDEGVEGVHLLVVVLLL